LEKTEENMRQVEALRHEIAPHLRFLKKQVEKVEKVRELREAAVGRFQAYFKREEAYLSTAKESVLVELKKLKELLSAISAKVADAKKTLEGAAGDKGGARILALSKDLDEARRERSEALRKASRLEGQIEAVELTASKATVGAQDIERIAKEADEVLPKLAAGALSEALLFFTSFIGKLRALAHSAESGAGDVTKLRADRDHALALEKQLVEKERSLSAALEKIRAELDAARNDEREKERGLFELASQEREARLQISMNESRAERLSMEEEEFKRDIAEAGALIGRDILNYQGAATVEEYSREMQEKEKRELEKTKIRLEEMGGGGGDEVMKEYQDATDREAFLERETADLHEAAQSLKSLISDLEKELGSRFTDGIHAINDEFTKLFALMFDGGSAVLVKTEEVVRRAPAPDEEPSDEDADDNGIADSEEEKVEGIDISLSIPRKRVKSLVMLSGGERALTSIALIFAMSSVNPPPFLVLDETDAALDESNSRRYGDMVESLAKKSQLMIITHNRETMSRAGILYGVTMGGDGVSKVLSVKLEEAVKVAK
jgi:chromosome segregation protein